MMGLIDDIIKALPENSILREKVRNLDAENTSLKAEVASLKDNKRELLAENKKLKDEIERLTQEAGLDEKEIQVLAHVGKSTAPFDVDSVAHALQLNSVEVKYFVEKLRERGYVAPAGRMRGQPPQYRVDQKGREYIIKNGLL
jgi:regulator of replication initiation timing